MEENSEELLCEKHGIDYRLYCEECREKDNVLRRIITKQMEEHDTVTNK